MPQHPKAEKSATAHLEQVEKLKELIAKHRRAASGGNALSAESLPMLMAVLNLAEYAHQYTWLSANQEVMEFHNVHDAVEVYRNTLLALDMFPLSPSEEEADEG